MKKLSATQTPRIVLAAALMATAFAAQAAGGYVVTKSEEAVVAAGMA
jgi:hypothetical protein